MIEGERHFRWLSRLLSELPEDVGAGSPAFALRALVAHWPRPNRC